MCKPLSVMRTLASALLLGYGGSRLAAVLPEDRADIMYHSYEGDNVEVDGPSLLVRKGVGFNTSVVANYYVDSVSSASVDVVSTASPYTEERTEYTLGADYLTGDTLLSAAFTSSDEDDYQADTASFAISQEFFGGMTTLSMAYGRGWDDVGRNGDDEFAEEVDRRNYIVGISQILTRNLLMGITWETVSDEGFLNNPYRSVRFLDPDSGTGYSYQAEVYPNTRTSNALGTRLRYHLPYRAAVHGGYRYFTDDWEIDAHTAEIGYTHPIYGNWTIELGYRYYTQTAAEFYSDLFPYEDAQNFLARDKELSTFDSHTLRFGVNYELPVERFEFLERGTVNFFYDYIDFSYDDFRDVTAGGVPGTEPLFSFSADVIQLYFSFWF